MSNSKYDDAIKLYTEKKYTRSELSNIWGYAEHSLTTAILKRGVHLWDKKTLDKKTKDEICRMYRLRRMNREQLIEKYGLTKPNLLIILYKNKLALWDRKDNKKPNYTNTNKNPNKYFNWAELKDHPMVNYNK